MNNGELKTLGWKILPWLADIVCALLVWWAVQINTQLKSMQVDITALQLWKAETAGNRWTALDHTKYADEQVKITQGLLLQISDLRQVNIKDMSEIKIALAQMPKTGDLPPIWFRDYVKAIEGKLDEHMKDTKKP